MISKVMGIGSILRSGYNVSWVLEATCSSASSNCENCQWLDTLYGYNKRPKPTETTIWCGKAKQYVSIKREPSKND